MYQLYVDLLSTRHQRDIRCFPKRDATQDLKGLYPSAYVLSVRKLGYFLIYLSSTLRGFGLPRKTSQFSNQVNTYLKEVTR
jgi:hypothetical protein